MNPAPFRRHQRVAFQLALVLHEARRTGSEVLTAPIDWRYDADGAVQPDVVVVSEVGDGDSELDGPIPSSVIPMLLVEVVSSNAMFDRTMKRDLYQRLRMPNYWIVDPGATDRPISVVALVLSADGVYETESEVTGAAVFTTERPFPVSFSPADLLRG